MGECWQPVTLPVTLHKFSPFAPQHLTVRILLMRKLRPQEVSTAAQGLVRHAADF